MPEGEEKKILNTLAKGAGITAIGMFISKLFTYLYRALVGRALGPEAYGMLATGMMIGGIAATFAGDPVRNGLKKFIPEFREDGDIGSIKGIVLSALQLNFIGALVVGTAIFFSAEYIAVKIFKNQGLIPVIQVFGFLQLISRPYEVFIDTTIAFNEAKYQVISTNIIQPILQLILTGGLIFLGFNVMGAVWGWVGAVALTLPLAFYFMEKKIGPILTEDVKAIYQRKKLFNFSYPLMLSGIVGVFLGWTDTAFLGYYMNQEAVGLYNAAFPTALLLIIPLKALNQIALTSFSELGAKEKDKTNALKTTSRWIFSISFPTFLIMALFSSQLLTLLFGKEFSSAGFALAVLAFGNLIDTSVGSIADLLKSGGHTKSIFYNNVANLAMNILLNILLIPILGIVGAAIATALSTILMNLLLTLEVWKYEKTHPFSIKMIYPTIAGTTSLGIVYILFDNIFVQTPYWSLIPAGILFYSIYIVILAKIGGFTQYDKEIVHTIGRKIGQEKKVEKFLKLLT